MRILLLSFYYTPDLGPCSLRAAALTKALVDVLETKDHIDVLTTQPNRYHSFNPAADAVESNPGVQIIRCQIPRHKNGLLSQSAAWVVYAWRVLRLLRGQQYDLVIATSSRLMTAFLGALISHRQQIPLSLDIRDIFVDNIQYALKPWLAKIVLPVLQSIEKYTVSKAEHVNLVSAGFCKYFENRYPGKKYSVITNGIDDNFVNMAQPSNTHTRQIVLYAGNIGDGQGLHNIVPGLAAHTRSTHEFLIVGDGGAHAQLVAAVAGLDNVRIISPLARQELLTLYQNSDYLFLHLNDYPAFHHVLPSKLFEYAATGKPIIAGVAGYAANFLAALDGVAVFAPCDVEAGIKALTSLPAGCVPRHEFVDKFQRAKLMQQMAQDILRLLRTASNTGIN